MMRRFVITIGVGVYRDSGIRNLPGAADDARRMRELFTGMGYTAVLPELASLKAQDVPTTIGDWVAEVDLTGEDVVVVYFAGHGVKDSERHYLLWPTSVPDRGDTAVASEDLARPLMSDVSRLGHLLVVLDTCYAGFGGGDVAKLANELATGRRAARGCWTLAAARGKEMATENAFVNAFTHGLDQMRNSTDAEFHGIGELTAHVNDYFEDRKKPQRATHCAVEITGGEPFLPNPAHRPTPRPDGLDAARLAELRQRNHAHFDPPGRGVGQIADLGDYFTGRAAALRELTSWLSSGTHDRKARVVTGAPGSGKTAVLGRVFLHPACDVPVVPLHARRATLDSLVRQLAGVLGRPDLEWHDLLGLLRERTTPLVVIVDAVDEAGPAGDTAERVTIARRFLTPLTTLPALRLIIGTRRMLVSRLGQAVRVIDLDNPEYTDIADVAAYARDVLLDAQDPASLSPYRGRPDLASAVGDAIAARAGTSFLVARLTATALVHGQIEVDPNDLGHPARLPSDVGEALDEYLAWFGPAREKAERLLRPLAYAQGMGLPRTTLWTQLSAALSGVECTTEDLNWLHDHAGAFLVTNMAEDGPVFRLFHETMAEHLRIPDQDTESHRTITAALLDTVRTDPATGRRDWTGAHPYLREHLATHAAAGQVLDPLVADSGFLAHASPDELMLALHSVSTPEALRTRTFYRASAAVHRGLDPVRRRQVLAMDATRHGASEHARVLAETLEWRPSWATGTQISPALHATLTGHEQGVTGVACAIVDERPVAVTTSFDGSVRVWDPTTGRPVATFEGHKGSVRAVACTTLAGRPVAVTGGEDQTVRVWDLAGETLLVTYRGHIARICVVACATVAGAPVAVTGDEAGVVRVWDLTTGANRAVTSVEGMVNALACATVGDRSLVVVASAGRTVRVWELSTGAFLGVLGEKDVVKSLACGTVKGRAVVAIAGDREVTVWDLTQRIRRAVLAEHESWVNAVAWTTVGGQPMVVTGTDNGAAWVCDVLGGQPRAVLAGHHSWINAVAGTELRGRPVAVTAGNDRAVRVWDLPVALDQGPVTEGHTGEILTLAMAGVNGRAVLLSGGVDPVLRMWDLASGAPVGALAGHERSVDSVDCARVGDRQKAVTASSDGTMRVWDLATRELEHTFADRVGPVVSVLCTHCAGRPVVVTAGADRDVRVWDLESGELVRVLAGVGPVRALAGAIVAGQQVVFVSGRDGSVRMWDLTADRSVLIAEYETPAPAITSAVVAGEHVGVTTGDSAVQVWDLGSGRQRSSMRGHGASITAVDHTTVDSRPMVVTTSSDGTMRVWDLVDNRLRATVTAHTSRVLGVGCTTLDGRPVAVTLGADQTVRIWDLTTTRELAVFDFSAPIGAMWCATDTRHLVVATGWDLITLTR